MKQLLLFFALMSVLMTLLASTNGPWPWLIGMAALLVAAHVVGTLIGTRLRDSSQEVIRWRVEDPAIDSDEPVATVLPVRLAELGLPQCTTLADLGKKMRWRSSLVALGALLGGTAGGFAFVAIRNQPPSLPALAVGVLSCSVIGAWAVFLASSFIVIVRHAWQQTHGN